VMISVIMNAARSVSAATRYRESASEGRE